MNKTDTNDPFKDYVPETVEYNPEVDGSDEHMIRDEHLAEKERLKALLTKKKEEEVKDKKVIK